MLAAAAMVLTGCMTTRHTEQTAAQVAGASSSVARLDSLASLQMKTATAKEFALTESQTTLAIGSEGIAEESATLDVSILTLRDLPEGAGYTAKDGRAGVELRKEGDNIKITGRCDSISRLYLFYQAANKEQRREIDSLQWELDWLEKWSARQADEIKTLQASNRLLADKPPESRHWWALAGFVAGVACAGSLKRFKSKLSSIIKK